MHRPQSLEAARASLRRRPPSSSCNILGFNGGLTNVFVKRLIFNLFALTTFPLRLNNCFIANKLILKPILYHRNQRQSTVTAIYIYNEESPPRFFPHTSKSYFARSLIYLALNRQQQRRLAQQW